jgi:hypothetical protein
MKRLRVAARMILWTYLQLLPEGRGRHSQKGLSGKTSAGQRLAGPRGDYRTGMSVFQSSETCHAPEQVACAPVAGDRTRRVVLVVGS